MSNMSSARLAQFRTIHAKVLGVTGPMPNEVALEQRARDGEELMPFEAELLGIPTNHHADPREDRD